MLLWRIVTSANRMITNCDGKTEMKTIALFGLTVDHDKVIDCDTLLDGVYIRWTVIRLWKMPPRSKIMRNCTRIITNVSRISMYCVRSGAYRFRGARFLMFLSLTSLGIGSGWKTMTIANANVYQSYSIDSHSVFDLKCVTITMNKHAQAHGASTIGRRFQNRNRRRKFDKRSVGVYTDGISAYRSDRTCVFLSKNMYVSNGGESCFTLYA